MNYLDYALVTVVGLIAGFVNTMAGGGSLLTIPVLIFLGLPSAVANGTNRLAVLIQSLAAVGNFKKKGYFDFKLSFMFAIPAIIGSLIGSTYAVNLSDARFNRILGIVMIAMLFIIIFQPHKKLDSFKGNSRTMGMVIFFFVGLYGGLIQAGAGFMIIMALTIATSFSLVRINSMKMLIVAIYMVPSLIIFIKSGNIDFYKGIILAISNSVGAWIGSNVQINRGDKIVKVVLTISVLAMSLKLLGFINI